MFVYLLPPYSNSPSFQSGSQRFNRADVDSIGDPFLCLGVSTRDYVIGSVCYIFLWGGTLLFYYLMMQLLTVVSLLSFHSTRGGAMSAA
jgi:hypothetical protein